MVNTASVATSIGFIGGGNMAQALIAGLINSHVITAAHIHVAEPNTELHPLLTALGVNIYHNAAAACAHSTTCIIAVKPQVLSQVVDECASALAGQLIISIAAGINMATIAALVGPTSRIVRVMPNTPAMVGQGASGLIASSTCSDTDKTLAFNICSAVGLSVWANNEGQIDAITAISGSGPAYFFYMMEAMIEAGVAAGLSPEIAQQLTIQTALGAATLAKHSHLTPSSLRANVTSPAGTTFAAIDHMNKNNTGMHIRNAALAAYARSVELTAQLAGPSN